jgi:hypothetical protein
MCQNEISVQKIEFQLFPSGITHRWMDAHISLYIHFMGRIQRTRPFLMGTFLLVSLMNKSYNICHFLFYLLVCWEVC